MTFLVERLAELRRYVDHLKSLRPRVPDVQALEIDLSLHNDVLFSLLTLCQLVIDIAGEISGRIGKPFDNYTTAVRNLAEVEGFEPRLVESLARLPGFRNALIHDYVGLDLQRVVLALNELDPIDEFIRVVARFEQRQ